MAKVYALDESHCDDNLRLSIQNSLRIYDEALVLPQGHKSPESGLFKNTILNLHAQEPNLNADLFSESWFSGISAVEVDAKRAEAILNDPQAREEALKALVAAIPTEFANEDVTVGPELEAAEDDRDLKDWVCGFDSPGCCVGLYSAIQAKSVDATCSGISRSHVVYYLLCKAGGGISAQTFHSRLSTALKKGYTLEQAFAEKAKVNRSSTTTDTATTTTNTTDADGGAQSGADASGDNGPSPGAQALRRVSSAAHRNRCRILCLAADALGFHIDTLVDNACCESVSKRLAVATLSVTTNSITKNCQGGGGTYRYFSGAVDTSLSTGVVSCSNVTEGFLIFVDENGSSKINVKNAAFSGIPFSSQRIKSNKEAVMEAAEKLKAQRSVDSTTISAHPDSDWISKRFGWKGRDFGIHLEPPPLLGTFSNETFSSVWARELGLSNCRTVRLQPEVVCISATEPSKLRAAARHVLGKK
jgi:hypothetical protein